MALFPTFFISAPAGSFRFAADAEKETEPEIQSAAPAFRLGLRSRHDGVRLYHGSFTVEAALIVCLILGVLFFMIRLALARQGAVGQEAVGMLLRPGRYETKLRPTDLIYIGEFIQEWFPPK